MMNIKRTDNIRAILVRDETEETDVVVLAKRLKHDSAGHIARMKHDW